MDVVYIVGQGDPNDELRYSLRSLCNLPHDRVWIAGYCPPWVVGVGHIEVLQGKSKYRNSAANVKAACQHPEVSDEFIYLNDDFFVLRPVDGAPCIHRGPLEDLLRTHRRQRIRRRGGESYSAGRAETAALLGALGIEHPLAYEPLHTPMCVRKDLMLETLRVGESVPALHYRTLYGNLNAVGGEFHPNVKISDAHAVPRAEWAFASTNERAFHHGRIGKVIRDLFPEPGPYER